MSCAKIFENKSRGWIFLNGNLRSETDLISLFGEQIMNPKTFVPELNRTCKILMVTAAFEKGHEHKEKHIIEIFSRLGINPVWQNGYPTNIQNLSIYTMFEEFQQKEKWVYRRYTEKQDQIQAIKRDYFLKNRKYVDQVHWLVRQLKKTYPSLGLFDFFKSNEYKDDPRILLTGLDKKSKENKKLNMDKLLSSESSLKLVRDLMATISHIEYKDQEIWAITQFIEKHFLQESGVTNLSLYKEQREELKNRIVSSASIFLFGGRVYVLVNRLRFYQVGDFFHEALDQGTNIYGVSAGTLCQTDQFSMNFEKYFEGGYLRAEDSGMGLVNGLSIFPHANDYQYIRNADKDTLSFFAIRHPNRVVVGLNEKSVLLYEHHKNPKTGEVFRRISSQGKEPVLIFGERGKKIEMKKNSQILTSGTKFYKGVNQYVTQDEIEKMEKSEEKPLVEQAQNQESE
ncbi:Type 1 glutamine amidotransferase-like domain-containing protein [Candidatus Riflebacteria bacterium]